MNIKTSLLHGTRVVLLTGLVLAIGISQVNPAKINRLTSPSSSSNVLAYATSMSRSDLLAAANQSRAAQGLAPLSLNSQLNSSAQMKAQHMVDGNYWAHVSPDGVQPWYFFEAAGYSYLAAGENLAYGFATSFETNTGWMNSPSHRANILGSYKEVGFGFVNSSNFQGNENTVVVAHYATPSVSAPAPTPTPKPKPKPKPKPQPEPETLQSSTESANQPTPATDSTPTAAEKPKKTETVKKPTETAKEKSEEEIIIETNQPTNTPPINIGTTAKVSVWQSLLSGTLPQRFIISLSILAIVMIGYTLAHRSLIRQAVASGQGVALRHPLLDVMVLITAILIVMTTSVAWLQ